MIKVSVIIPVFNEDKVLRECLESLCYQTYKSFEVIAVDDGSNDKTSRILSDLRFKKNRTPCDKDLRILKQDHKGAGSARNLGAKSAKGRILVFVDADMTFDKGFLEKLIAPIMQNLPSQDLGEVKGTFSKEELVSNWNNVWARCWNINEGWEERRRHPKNYPDHQPVFRAILKSEFDRVGSFTPGGYDDDWSLSKKLGYEATAAPGAIFYHKNPESLSEIFTHAKWVGKRSYKLGLIGYLVALFRSSFPVSLIVGFYKSFTNSNFHNKVGYSFLIFKIVYDFGIFVGIIEYLITGRSSK